MNELQLKRWEKVRKNGKLNFILVQTLKYAMFMTAGSSLFYFLLQNSVSLKIVMSIFFLIYLIFGFFLFSRAWKRNENAYLKQQMKN